MKSYKPFRIDYFIVVAVMALPLIWLMAAFQNGDLGVNPLERLIRELGLWGLRGLILTLMITPLAKLGRWPLIQRWRRPIGLMSALYIGLHLMAYMGFELGFDMNELIKDLSKRPFILVGMVGFVLILPLVVTSFNAAIRWLRFQNWKRLQSLIYVIVVLGVLHHFMLIKADKSPALLYGAMIAILLGFRLYEKWQLHKGKSAHQL
jgi:methionine sulfoxide reductase heme-binding subunit